MINRRMIMAKTYIENEVVPHIPEEYTEDNLRKKLEKRENSLWDEIEKNMESHNKLKNMREEAKLPGIESIFYPTQHMQKDILVMRAQTERLRFEADEISVDKKLLDKYGQAFANLYYIKEQHEMKGYDGKLSFTEVDITGNGDIITASQHYGMSFDPNGRLTQPALVMKIDDLEFNVGMMEFNKPNSAPEVKLQLSFDENTANNLDVDKLGAIFYFFDKHGISSSDMIVRRFDGSIDDGAIQDKMQKLIAEAEAKRTEKEAEAAKEEHEQQKSREEELVKEIEKIVADNGKELPKGLSLEEAVKAANELLPKDKQLNIEEISADLPKSENITEAAVQANEAGNQEGVEQSKADIESENQVTTPENQAASSENSVTVPSKATAKKVKKVTLRASEEKFEKFLEEGLAKRRNLSYFKTHTGLFGTGWTEYVIYDTEDKKNRKNDGIEDKNGNVKYTYNFKLFIRENKNGGIDFGYRTPNHKPLNEDIVGGIVGQLKDLGFTHVNFPSNIPDKEKGIWRKALAEKGLVPLGMSLDRAKAEGMIKAAKEKLSSEAFSKYKYRLALQMKKHNESKGKKVDKSEQDFIEGLLLAHKYETFSNGYSEVLKGKITRLVHPKQSEEKEDGALFKIAAMSTLRRLFDAFKEGVETGGILNSGVLTDKEKVIIGENPSLTGNPSKFTGSQLAELYDIMFKHNIDIARIELEKKFREPGAKRADEAIKQGEFNAAYNSCKSIIKELKALGVDEIDLPETTIKLPYRAPIRNKPNPTPTQTQTKPVNSVNGNIAASRSYERA